MADLQSAPELKNTDEVLKEAVENAVPNAATPESASPENLEALPAQVEGVREEMVAAPVEVEAAAESAPQQNLGSVLEVESLEGVPVHPESKGEISNQAHMLDMFVSGKLSVLEDGEVPSALVLKTLQPKTED